MDEKTTISGMDRLLHYLMERSSDRGLMADVRAGLRLSTQARAWPVISKFCDLTKPSARVFEVVAGLYALHPLVCESKNMGRLCRDMCDEVEDASLRTGRGLSEDVKEGPMAKRFKRLLDADRDEICDLVVRIVMYAKSKNVPVDYRSLGRDLIYWGSRTQREWAQGFWGQNEIQNMEDK